MKFYVRKRKQSPAVIIVALIDILIVLVIFLMVTTTFKQQSALKLSLPESSQAKRTGAQESPPLIVTVDPKGNLRLGPEAKPVTVEELKTELAAELSKSPELKLAINGDEGAPWGKIVRVMDAAKAVGIKGVNAFTKEPAGAH
jgi:biopolymer transport protein ExbD